MSNSIPTPSISELRALTVSVALLLKTQKDLSPNNPLVNQALTQLVSSVQLAQASFSPAEKRAVLDCPAVAEVRTGLLDSLAQAEGSMEAWWAERLTTDPSLSLKDFWYLDHYQRLVAEEVALLKSSGSRLNNSAPIGRVAFAGSGPLPVTAFRFVDELNADVLCLDTDGRAVRQSARLAEKFGYGDKIFIRHDDAARANLSGVDVLVIASLAEPKSEIVANATAQGVRHIAVRTAVGLNSLLYSPVDVAAMRNAGLTVRGQSNGWQSGEVINTTLLFDGGRALAQSQQLSAQSGPSAPLEVALSA